ncbi:serine/threonine protein phosphatase (plasmid) [Pontibacillus sp. ALD_SL1]|uniref:metallophosphoesterase family protein n=1 Tax=Pontibacillus sp. ALD_SL1 TaxID=2777185 RepID=UPI001A971FB9|nr:metallophosphoesterase family protein [Pontibacillus sp. ALD_SL1]QST02263.1 serine/threonine protein phosphatase [Pontibacillus sp. ALD_SL1]
MRNIIISDIHGCYNTFMNLLNLVQYTTGQDHLILLGDYIDRGPRSKEVIDWIINEKETGHVTALRGNHEEMFLSWLHEPIQPNSIYLHPDNGGKKTIKSYLKPRGIYSYKEYAQEAMKSYYPQHIRFFEELPFYYEDKHAIYVHAGVDLNLRDWKNSSDSWFTSSRERFWKSSNPHDKTIIFGHTPVCFLHDSDAPYTFEDNRIAIDGGCSYKRQLNALIVDKAGYTALSVPYGE